MGAADREEAPILVLRGRGFGPKAMAVYQLNSNVSAAAYDPICVGCIAFGPTGTEDVLAACSGDDGQQVFLDYESGELTNEWQAVCFGVC